MGLKQEDEKKTIAEILNMVNSPFVGILNENDKIIRQILEELMRNPELADAIRANNSRDVLVNICRQKFDDTIVDQIEKYFHLKELIRFWIVWVYRYQHQETLSMMRLC